VSGREKKSDGGDPAAHRQRFLDGLPCRGPMTASLRAARVAPIGMARFRRGILRVQGGVKPTGANGRGEALTAAVDWAELIGRVASGSDRAAFKTLFEHFAPRIKGFLIKTGCSADDAEEIAQGTLVAVWTKAAQFDPSSAGAAAWIFTIARNLRIDAARRAARSGRIAPQAALDDEADPGLPADSIVSRVEETARVTAAIEKLSAEQSTVIRLSFIEEQPHAEIATALGLPLGTVKSRIRLAMNRLRQLLDDVT
jgi:RNA polymerase sigma factor (sigma-70 family)